MTFSREDELDDSFRGQDASGLVEDQYEYDHGHSKLGLRATAKLSFQFCLLWVRRNCAELLGFKVNGQADTWKSIFSFL